MSNLLANSTSGRVSFRACKGAHGHSIMVVDWDMGALEAVRIRAEVMGPDWEDTEVRRISVSQEALQMLLTTIDNAGVRNKWYHYYRRSREVSSDWSLEIIDGTGDCKTWDGFADGPDEIDAVYDAFVAAGMPEGNCRFSYRWDWGPLQMAQDERPWMHVVRYHDATAFDGSRISPLSNPWVRDEFLEDLELFKRECGVGTVPKNLERYKRAKTVLKHVIDGWDLGPLSTEQRIKLLAYTLGRPDGPAAIRESLWNGSMSRMLTALDASERQEIGLPDSYYEPQSADIFSDDIPF